MRPFEELAVGDHLVELGVADEMIVDAVDLAGADRPGRRGDRHGDAVVAVEQHARDRRLAGAARARQDEEQAPPLEGACDFHGRYWRGGPARVKGRRGRIVAKMAHGADGRAAAGGQCRRAASCRWPSCATLCAELGWQDVATYIQSGNVVFDAAGKPAALEAALEAAIAERFGFDVPVIVRTRGAVGGAMPPAIPSPRRRATRRTGCMLLLSQAAAERRTRPRR